MGIRRIHGSFGVRWQDSVLQRACLCLDPFGGFAFYDPGQPLCLALFRRGDLEPGLGIVEMEDWK